MKLKSIAFSYHRRFPLPMIMLPALALLLLSGCLDSANTPKTELQPLLQDAVFVGNAECAGCHPQEFQSHSASNHANTLHRVEAVQAKALVPPVGKVAATEFTIQQQKGKFVLGQPEFSDETVAIDYVLGSGKTGVTYVSLIPGGRLAEFRRSYFPKYKEWYPTPGHEMLAKDELGKVHTQENGHKCLMCHAVAVDAETLTTEKRFFGVGCESCHGAGSRHIEAVRSGQVQNAPMEKLGRYSASQLNNVCAKCHGTATEIAGSSIQREATNRFQVYGLAQSRCYQQSADTLSCISCHNPHENASKRTADYEAKCLSCHTQKKDSVATVSAVKRIVVCPVDPKTACIGCHMPSKPAIPGTKIPTYMADHFIRVYK